MMAPGQSGWRRILIGAHPRRTAVRLAIVIPLLLAIGYWVVLPTRVEGTSMEPTVRDGSWRLVNLMRYRHRTPARGDIVAVQLAGRKVMLLKRVLATPGDRVAFQRGELRINGQHAEEPYVVHKGPWDMPETRLGPDEVFIAGDNRRLPAPQHVAGVVKINRIVGGLI